MESGDSIPSSQVTIISLSAKIKDKQLKCSVLDDDY